MKLSTRIKKIDPTLVSNGVCPMRIRIMLDCKLIRETTSWTLADADHYTLTSVHGYKYLPQESPVISGDGSIYFHYASTTYAKWCNK